MLHHSGSSTPPPLNFQLIAGVEMAVRNDA